MEINKKGFTLIELLSVVVILGITFMFILPSITELFTMGNKTETELIEERVLAAAKEYVNNVDGTFYTKLYKEGDTNYVYKTELLNFGLINEDEISKLNNFIGVKGEVLKNDKIRYTVEYINNSLDNYSSEELYFMIQNLSEKIDNNTKSITNFTNIESKNNIFLKNYPVGSIYISENNTSPEELFGGEWEEYGVGKTLVGVDSSQTEFATVGKTGGAKTHTLSVNEMPSHGHPVYVWVNAGTKANAWYFDGATQKTHSGGRLYNADTGSWIDAGQTITSAANGRGDISGTTNKVGGSQPHNNLQPYITVYMWKRTA